MRRAKIIGLFFIILFVTGFWLYQRPLPELQAESILSEPPAASAVNLPWPTYGQAAIGATDYGVLTTHGEQKPVPIASITKVVTALAVLKEKPLALGENGPNITITDEDVAIYNEYYSLGGSVTPITKGSQISEYDGLQSMLIPSSNNMAATVAKWAFGSVDNYVKYANQMLKDMGFTHTHVDEASGFSVNSVSTATELIKLGELALGNEVIADIVKKSTAILPVAGEVRNINTLVGTEGVIGIKTGNTEAAGGTLLFASKRDIGGNPVTVIGVVLGAPDRAKAISDSKTLLQSVNDAFETVIVAKRGQVVGRYETPWGARPEIIASDDLDILVWKGAEVKSALKPQTVSVPKRAGAHVGELNAFYGQQPKSVPIELKEDLPGPDWRWRIFR